jgi:hypothetical protein
MKNILPYLIVFLVSSVAAGAMVVGVLMMRPDLKGAATVHADSAAARTLPPGRAYGPTLAELAGKGVTRVPANGPANTPVSGPGAATADELLTGGDPADSLQVLRLALEDERKRSALLAEQLRVTMDSTRKATAVADSEHAETRKSMAKVLEAMDPSSAARILKDYPDGDVKQMILTMKKRQAARILAALEPDRAARIMR